MVSDNNSTSINSTLPSVFPGRPRFPGEDRLAMGATTDLNLHARKMCEASAWRLVSTAWLIDDPPVMSASFWSRGRLPVWGALLGATTVVFAVALSPPFLSSPWDTVVMHAFAPVCHQMAVRSPHIGEIQIALCDRCTGIYLGLALGVLAMPLLWPWRKALRRRALPMLLGATGLLGLDWIGPVLGAWPNVPISRFLTGGLLGIAAGLLVGLGILQSVSSTEGAKREAASAPSS
jgi:uncharacterized membrane protein